MKKENEGSQIFTISMNNLNMRRMKSRKISDRRKSELAPKRFELSMPISPNVGNSITQQGYLRIKDKRQSAATSFQVNPQNIEE